MPRAKACNNCKIALVLKENDVDNLIQEDIFNKIHQNHMVVIGDISEFGNFTKYE